MVLRSASWIAAFAPATVANVGPGYDVFGLALEEPGDVVSARLTDEPGVVRIASIEGDGGRLPRDADANTAGRAARAILDAAPEKAAEHGIELELIKGLPLCSGLGSSGASAAAAAFVALTLVTDGPVDARDALGAAIAAEAVAAGAPHADNVAPSLLGGFTIVRPDDPTRPARFEPTLPCRVVVVTPDHDVPTREARAALPASVPLADAVANVAAGATLVAGLITGDADLVRRGLADRLVEPHRAALIPGFADVKAAATDAGALGGSISGAGPSVFALVAEGTDDAAVAEAMVDAFARHGLEASAIRSPISGRGVRRR